MQKRYLIPVLAGMLLFVLAAYAAPPPGAAKDSQAAQTRVLDVDDYINANKLLMFTTNVGAFAKDYGEIFGKTDGLYYPYVSVEAIEDGTLDKTAIYAAGLWLGGTVNSETRLAVAEYSHEYGPGPMTPGGSYDPDAFDNPDYRVYKLYADSLEFNPNQDYLDWPADQGAPVDGFGRPLMMGDQMLWTVFNDADASLHTNRAGRTAPLGIEVQQRVWAVDEDGEDSLWGSTEINVLEHHNSRVNVSVHVVDPEALTGHDYMVVTLGLASPTTANWELHNLTLGGFLLLSQPEIIIDGMRVTVSVESPRVDYWEWGPDPGARSLTGYNWGGSGFFGGMGMGWEFLGTSLNDDQYVPIEIRWESDGAGQSAYCYRRDLGYDYDGYHPNQNMTAWDISSFPARQVNFAFVEYYDPAEHSGQNADSVWNPGDQLNLDGMPDYWSGREYLFILNSDYSPVEDSRYAINHGCWGPPDADFDCLVSGWVKARWGTPAHPAPGEYLRIFPQAHDIANDTFTFTSEYVPPGTSGPEGLSIYMEYKLYNRGGNHIDDCHVSVWSDPDLGGPSDDLVGCDTMDNLWFCYNGYGRDEQYDWLTPAVGFKLLLGPLVPSPDDTAFFDGQLWPGYKNLGMTALNKYINGTDPVMASETYNYMQGLLADGSPYMYEGQVLKYHHSGDPVDGSGDIDRNPVDVRMLASMGPFTFNPGDSQYVMIKLAVGQGPNRLASVTRLKEILNIPFETPSCCYFRGDLNRSGGSNPVDISDVVFLVNILYGTTLPPYCMDDADVNASGGVDITDLVYLVDYMFRGGPPPMPCP